MYLNELIEALEKESPNKFVKFGFARPHSYRGDYHQLAFEPKTGTSVGEMLTAARSAIGKTFQGWKGGDFVMGEHSECWLAYRGNCGETIGPTLLSFMLGEPKFSQET